MHCGFWQHLDHGFIKFNCNDAFMPNGSEYDIGLVARDHLGSIAFTHHLVLPASSSLVVECHALLYGLLLAKRLNCSHIVLEIHCQPLPN